MKNKIAIILVLLLSIKTYGQISLKDSTVQVIGYWSKLDKQSYDISFEKLKIKNKDTIARELIKYEVDLKVIDSTPNSYTTEWHYKNFEIDTDNKLVKKLTSISNDISVLIKTDEFGSFMEVINWQNVRDYLNEVSEKLKTELKHIPNSAQIIENVMKIYSSKKSIEANAIKDAIQFYNFHGVKYKLGEEISGDLKVSNNFGGKPFDTKVKFSLDEINAEDGNSIIRMKQVVNSKQLTNETYNYLKKIGTFGKNIPKLKNFPSLTNETYTASRIHGETGWVIYSIETKEVKAENTTNIEERIIEIK
ncbi:hypothetical protein [Polaribacter sp. R77954]|uniref:hypothetical protein n=1 Tax=Polaribacter sp. R77954 TaxID=3093870 RepID=UPI0037C9C98F